MTSVQKQNSTVDVNQLKLEKVSDGVDKLGFRTVRRTRA